MKRNVETIVIICGMLLAVAYFVYSLFVQEENAILRSDIRIKNELVEKYKERDSIMRRVYMGADSTGTFVYRHVGDSIISYRTLLDIVDRLEDELNEYKKDNKELKDSLWVKSSVIKMLDEDIDFSYEVKKENGRMTVSLFMKN